MTSRDKFRDMVKALHKAGIEIILDVVFNHTDEGNHQGPVCSFKGIDNSRQHELELRGRGAHGGPVRRVVAGPPDQKLRHDHDALARRTDARRRRRGPPNPVGQQQSLA
jgi:hypothetical protein